MYDECEHQPAVVAWISFACVIQLSYLGQPVHEVGISDQSLPLRRCSVEARNCAAYFHRGTNYEPPIDPDVADLAPSDPALTRYDEEHLVTYLRMLDANVDGADRREVLRIVLHIAASRSLIGRTSAGCFWP